MTSIKIDLNIDDINLILESLGQQPFARVYALIGRMQEQAHEQLQGAGARGDEPAEVIAHAQ